MPGQMLFTLRRKNAKTLSEKDERHPKGKALAFQGFSGQDGSKDKTPCNGNALLKDTMICKEENAVLVIPAVPPKQTRTHKRML